MTLQPIPEDARTTRVSGQFWIWCGANIAPINWVLGALGVNLGLGLADTVIVLVVGNLIGIAVFGFFVLLGQRTGATGMVLSRAAFGRRGNYFPATIQACLAIGWCAVNTWIILDLVMALFGKLGLVDPIAHNYGPRILVAGAIMLVQVVISWLGYKAIATFERWTVPPTIAILIAMSITAWFFLHINWGYAGAAGHILTGWPRLSAMSSIMTAIGIGWGITWFTYAADYSRFVSVRMPPSRLYLASTFGQFLPVVWLGVLGATLATKNGSVDPGQLVVENFGTMAIPVLLLVVHGPIATNILNTYTLSVATQALDVKIPRRALSVVVGVFAMAVVVFFIYQGDLASTLDAWLSGIVAWIASWGGIMLVHYYGLHRHETNVERLFDPARASRVPDVNWAGFIAFFGGIVMTWLFMFGSTPLLHGAVSTALHGVDLSWLAGGVTSAVLYAVLGPLAEKRFSGTGRPNPAIVSKVGA
ncbi:MAG: purine-cytosine permease family protein [Nocardioidaceae bacterium]